MNKLTLPTFFLLLILGFQCNSQQVITRQGSLSFFSYTTVENIEATNNQVYSVLDLSTNEIAISMLMRAFVFKKSLMQEHFNESYIESDIFPKATFSGKIVDLDNSLSEAQTKMAQGSLTIHGVTKEISIPVTIVKQNDIIIFKGDLDVLVSDFNIKIPPILAPNISKIISINFTFEYEPYEK